MLRWCKN